MNLTNILANDIGSNLSFEGLQDVYDNMTQIPITTGSISTVPTFYSLNIGLHLLRYVPFNSVTQQRGNITYVFVYVRSTFDNCSTANLCNLIANGGFELAMSSLPLYTPNHLNLACGWKEANSIMTPDYFRADANFPSIPNNLFGNQSLTTSGGFRYAGFVIQSSDLTNPTNNFNAETIINRLTTPLQPNQHYRFEMDLSLAENYASDASKVQIYFSNDPNLQISNGGQAVTVPININRFFETPTYISDTTNWTHVSIDFTTDASANEQYVYIGAIKNLKIINISTSNLFKRSYYYIDNVSLTPIDATLSLPETTCTNTAIELTQYLNPAPSSGTFSWSLNGGAFTNIVGNTFTPTTAGTYTINYTYTNNVGCPVTISDTIEVTVCNNPITPTFTQVAAICSGATLSALPTTSNNGITGTWSPDLNNTVTTTYTFTPTSGQNATTATMTVTVNSATTPTFTQVAAICSGATLSALPTTSNNGITGTWSPDLNNTATTTYTFTPTAGQCATTATMTVTVNPPTAPTFTQVAAICSGATLSALPTTSTNGITGTWSPALNNTTTTQYTFTPTTGQCATTATMTVTVNGVVISNSTPITQGVCVGATPQTLSMVATGSGTITYQWYSNTTNSTTAGTPIASNGTSSSYIPPTSNVATTLYYYAKVTANSCSLFSPVFAVTFYTKPVITSITGAQTLCKGATPVNLVVNATGGTTYQWYVSSSATGTGSLIPSATNSNYLPPTTTGGMFYYYVIVKNVSCEIKSSSVLVQVNGANILSTSPIAQTRCIGGGPSTVLNIQATGNNLSCMWYGSITPTTTTGTYLSPGTSSLSSNGYSFNYTLPTQSSPVTIYYYAVIKSNNSCTVTSPMFTVTYVQQPTISSITPITQAVCVGGAVTPITVTANASVPISYQWYRNTTNDVTNGTAIFGATSTSYNPPTNAVLSMYYYVKVSAGSCTTTSTAVYVNVIGAVVTSATPGRQTICPNTVPQPLVVTATGTNLTYQWYYNTTGSTDSGVAITGATSSSYTPTFTSYGTRYYYVVVTENGLCSTTSSIFQIIVLDDNITIWGTNSICLGSGNSTTQLYTNGIAGDWSSSDPSVADVDIATGLVTAYSVGTTIINYNQRTTNGSCKSPNIVITVLGNGSIVAVNDNFTSTPINMNTGGLTASVLNNDSINGVAVVPNTVMTEITGISSVPAQSIYPAITMVGGNLSVPPGAATGTYTITYKITSVGCTSFYATATATLIVVQSTVPSPAIAAGVRANSTVMDVDTQSTGKIIISGYFTTYNNVPCYRIAQLNNNLTLDTNFNASGAYPFDASNFSPYDMKVVKNTGANFNKILLAGWFNGWSGGTNGIGIARLHENGNLDTSFNTQPLANATALRGFYKNVNGTITKPILYELLIFPDTAPAGYAGKILVGGNFNRYNGYPVNGLILLDANGNYNPTETFNMNINNGTAGFDGIVGGLALQTLTVGTTSTTYLIVGGRFGTVLYGGNYKGIIRLQLNGATAGMIDSSFGSQAGLGLETNSLPGVDPYSGEKKAIVVQLNGKIIVGGYFHKYNGNLCNNLVRLNADGTYDATFVTGTGFNNGTVNPITGEPGIVRDLYLDTAQMKLYACGDFTSYNGTACDEVVRINCGAGAGTLDNSITSGFVMAGGGPNGTNNGPVWCMKKQEGDPKIIIGGKFTYYTDTTHPALNVTRILPANGTLTGEAKNSSIVYESEPEIDIFATTDLVLYPNPTDGLLNYTLPNYNDAYTIAIYDMTGKLIKTVDVNSNEYKSTIDFSNLPSATYLVRFNLNDKSITKTIIKK